MTTCRRACAGGSMTRFVGTWMKAALVCAAMMTLAPAAADAQSYSVYADCSRSDGWQPVAHNGNWAAYRDCGGWRPGMKAYVVPNNDSRTDVGSAAWFFRPPDGTKVINSARQGRSAPAEAMGTQTTWQPDWGWGALNLEAALGERTNGAAASVPGGSARFFRATGVAAADRATLVWQRRGTGCYQPGCYPSAMTLTNLDLQQLDPVSGAVQAQSNSAIDNVEQVRSPGAAATAIYKVKASSSVDGLTDESFAVTARRPLTALASPQPVVTADVAAGTQRAQETTTVTATVRNPSADLTAENASVTL